MSAKLISITGLPAAGKTTLAEHLAEALPAEILYEDYAGNPFLPEAYAGRAEAPLPAQLCYLMSRLKQLSRWSWPADGVVVSDYGFCQDRIYAERQLGGMDLELYDQVAGRLEGLVKRPDLIVHLDASPAVLLERIARRGRAFEQGMTEAFLASLRGAYDRLERSVACDVIRIDCEAVDPRDGPAKARLLRQIRERL